jgi:putative ABC transport system substrate-binding protein
MLRRRAFISLLGGAAVAWPLVARGQQREKMRRIGVLLPFIADDREGQARLMALAQGPQQSGWEVGSNLRIDMRWGAGDAERNRRYAAELLALTPDVVLANGTAETRALLRAAPDVPIVFANVPDPVGQGFVASLSRPGGNVTGFTPLDQFGQSGKWLELLKEIAPHVTRAAVLLNRALAVGIAQLGAIQAVAPSFGQPVPACGQLRRSHPQGRKASRPSGPSARRVPRGNQSQNGQGSRPRSAADIARPSRRGG